MDLEQLRTFVAVADCGSFAAAAKRLNHPKSTVAKRIGQLERTLGITLLERGQRAMQLTDEGRELLEPARDLIKNVEEVEATARTRAGRLAGTIRISVPTLLGQTILPEMLGRFVAQHLAVNLSIVAEDRYVDLVADGYDCAIRIGTGNDPTLMRRKLSQSNLILVASRCYVAAGDIVHPTAIEQLETIGFEPRSAGQVWTLTRGSNKVEIVPTHRLTFRSLPAIAALLQGYPSIALLPKFLVSEKIRCGELVRICADWCGDCNDITIVFSKKHSMPPRVRALIEHLANEFRDLELLLSIICHLEMNPPW